MSISNSPLITAHRASRWLMALALAVTPAAAQTITPQIGGGIGFTFDGGISGRGVTVAPPSCASPTAPNGQIDLSQCSNASYAAVIF